MKRVSMIVMTLFSSFALGIVSPSNVKAATLDIEKNVSSGHDLKPQANAEFKITKMIRDGENYKIDDQDDKFETTVKTDANGTLEVKNLTKGYYQISELNNSAAPVIIHLDQDQTLTYVPKYDLHDAQDTTDNDHAQDLQKAGQDNKDTSQVSVVRDNQPQGTIMQTSGSIKKSHQFVDVLAGIGVILGMTPLVILVFRRRSDSQMHK